MLILGQKPYFLGPTIFKIPQPNWHYSIAIKKPIKSRSHWWVFSVRSTSLLCLQIEQLKLELHTKSAIACWGWNSSLECKKPHKLKWPLLSLWSPTPFIGSRPKYTLWWTVPWGVLLSFLFFLPFFRIDVFQSVSMCFNVFWCVLMCFDMFWCVLTCFDVFWCIAMCFDVLRCVLLSFNVF